MVNYYDDSGVFDAPVAKVWDLIAAHSDANIHHIHGAFRSAKTLEEADGVKLREFGVENPDGTVAPMQVRFTARPPLAWTAEYVTGPFAGSWVNSIYVAEGDKTRVIASGHFTMPGLDDASILKIVDDFMNGGFAEDAAYLKKM